MCACVCVCVCVLYICTRERTQINTGMTTVLAILLMIGGAVAWWWTDRNFIESAIGWGGE